MIMWILQNYVAIKGAYAHYRGRDADLKGLSFFQLELAQVKDTDRWLHTNATYFHCNKKGYYNSKCPIRSSNNSDNKDRDEEGVSNFHVNDTTFLSSESDSSNKEVGVMFCHVLGFEDEDEEEETDDDEKLPHLVKDESENEDDKEF